MQAPSSKAERFNCRDEPGKINIRDLFEKQSKQKYKAAILNKYTTSRLHYYKPCQDFDKGNIH